MIEMEYSFGDIHSQLDTAYKLAEETSDMAMFVFNDREIYICKDSSREDIMRHFWRDSDRRSPIGPYPASAVTLEDEQLATARGGTLVVSIQPK